MALKDDILQKAVALKLKYKYSSNAATVRPGGALNYTDNLMDCSEFVLFSVKGASTALYNKMIVKVTVGGVIKDGGNTSTIKDAILKIEGWANWKLAAQTDPGVGDWIIWERHVEIIESVTAAGRYITLGANGADDGDVPKNIDSRNFTNVKTIAPNFLGIWTPKVGSAIAKEPPLVELLSE